MKPDIDNHVHAHSASNRADRFEKKALREEGRAAKRFAQNSTSIDGLFHLGRAHAARKESRKSRSLSMFYWITRFFSED